MYIYKFIYSSDHVYLLLQERSLELVQSMKFLPRIFTETRHFENLAISFEM